MEMQNVGNVRGKSNPSVFMGQTNKLACVDMCLARKSNMETEPFRLDSPTVRRAVRKRCEKASIVEYVRRDIGGGI